MPGHAEISSFSGNLLASFITGHGMDLSPHFCNFGYLMGLLKNCMAAMQPYAEMRDILGLEDRMAENGDVVHQLLAAGAVAVVMEIGDNQGEDALSANGSAKAGGVVGTEKEKGDWPTNDDQREGNV
ncbi:hypothetical protein ACQJBY_064833 [Aegilops geniculata]